MKRKRADRPGWKRVPKKRFVMHHVETQGFSGYVSLLLLEEVQPPLWVRCEGRDVCLADNGYTWLQQFPRAAHYAVTSFYDAQGTFVRWYIDICKRHYLDAQGVFWYEDLYLDLDVSPDGDVKLLDVDELDVALQQGEVTSLDYELAWREAHSLMTALEEDLLPLLWMNDLHREQLLRKLEEENTYF